MVDKLKMESVDMTQKNIERIRDLFPNVITEIKDEEGKLKKGINFELLKQELNGEVIEGEECYDFTWVGKKSAIVESNTPIRKTLRPCIEESKDWGETGNLYIEGDNLEVLKLLQESYLNLIKMIYIDPPYNTGKDFIYRDSYIIGKDEYNEQINLYDEEDNRLFQNTETNGRFHSDWCSMIYPRLKLARNLLTDDGVIFISIDDNELDNMTKICNEIFGEDNHLETFHIQVRYGNKSLNEKDDFQKLIEYVLIYAKSRNSFIPKKEKEEYNLKKFNLDIKELKTPDKQEIINGRKVDIFLPGNYSITTVEDEATQRMLFFKETWITGSIYSGTGHGKVYQQVVEPRVVVDGLGVLYKIYGLGEDGLGYRYMTGPKQASANYGKMYSKIPLDKLEGLKAGTYMRSKPILNFYDYSPDFGNIRHEGGIAFNSGKKPVKMLKSLLNFANLKNDDVVLDFFSGSSSTAHAVMQLNAEEQAKIKFIMVQLPEACDEKSESNKYGFKTICDIGKQRIRNVGAKMHEEAGLLEQKVDIGFRVLKLDSSNMKDVYYSAIDYRQSMLLDLESNIKEDRSDLDLLYGVLLDWGLPLSLSHKIEQIEGVSVHTVDEGSLVACFAEKISEKIVLEIANQQPLRVVFRDSSFANSPDKINVEEIFKLYAPNTTVKVI